MRDWTKTSCFLACPHYGSFTPACVGGIYLASLKFQPLVHFSGASLLAYNFNLLWCQALNMRRERPVGYFAMLHADVGPDPGWLDVLIEEMDATGADVMSAICPIKDQRGLTTTGIHDPEDKDMPPRTRRLTLKEVHKLPPTFDAAGAGFPGKWLALNTGCWVARLDRPWVDEFPGWTIMDGIATFEGGMKVARVFSEDWHWSQWLNKRGVKLFATRKVNLTHTSNNATYPNTAWGDCATDEGDFPALGENEIKGWMTATELEWLAQEAARHVAIVEIGSWHGRSTKALATATPGQVIAVDHFQGCPEDPQFVLVDQTQKSAGLDARTAFHRNLKTEMDANKVVLIEKESTEAAAAMNGFKADMIFIDGSHDTDSVKKDIIAWRPKLSENGLLCGHDGNDPRVKAALNELLPGWRIAAGTIWEYQAA